MVGMLLSVPSRPRHPGRHLPITPGSRGARRRRAHARRGPVRRWWTSQPLALRVLAVMVPVVLVSGLAWTVRVSYITPAPPTTTSGFHEPPRMIGGRR